VDAAAKRLVLRASVAVPRIPLAIGLVLQIRRVRRFQDLVVLLLRQVQMVPLRLSRKKFRMEIVLVMVLGVLTPILGVEDMGGNVVRGRIVVKSIDYFLPAV
jgi:hypothetical protein